MRRHWRAALRAPDSYLGGLACKRLGVMACRAGDGDCGSTLRRGAEAVRAALAGRREAFDAASGAAEALAAAVSSMGGTSGALYSLGLTAAAGEAQIKAAATTWVHCPSQSSLRVRVRMGGSEAPTRLSGQPRCWDMRNISHSAVYGREMRRAVQPGHECSGW